MRSHGLWPSSVASVASVGGGGGPLPSSSTAPSASAPLRIAHRPARTAAPVCRRVCGRHASKSIKPTALPPGPDGAEGGAVDGTADRPDSTSDSAASTTPRRSLALLGLAGLCASSGNLAGSANAGTGQVGAEEAVKSAYDGYAESYDQLDSGGIADTLGLPDLRQKVLEMAYGDVLEVGVGTGLNLPLYTFSKLDSLSALDLSIGMLEEAKAKAQRLPAHVSFQQGSVQEMPYEDGSFDSVVDTFSLCVYPDPQKALEEMRRVTRTNGQVLLLAHTRSDNGLLGLYQDLTADAVKETGKGCVWNQDVLAMLHKAGLEVVSERRHLGGLLSTIVARPAKKGQ